MLRSVSTFFHGRNAFYVSLLLLPPQGSRVLLAWRPDSSVALEAD